MCRPKTRCSTHAHSPRTLPGPQPDPDLFTADPKLVLTGSVLGGQLDESSRDGRANKRFRVVLVDWMTAHADQIIGLDQKRPLLMQVDLLSEAQLVQRVDAADSMKPK